MAGGMVGQIVNPKPLHDPTGNGTGERILITGASGSGKSYLLKMLMESAKVPVIFWNPLAIPEKSSDFAAVAKFMMTQKTGIITITPPAKSDPIRHLNATCELVLAMAKRLKKPFFMAIDEMHIGYPEQKLASEFRSIGYIISHGRTYGITVLAASQRIKEVNNKFRGNLTRLVTFKMTNQNDLAVVKAKVSGHKFARIRDLPARQFVVINETIIDLNAASVQGPFIIKNGLISKC